MAPVPPRSRSSRPRAAGRKNDLLIVVESSLRTAEDFTIDTPKPQLARRTNPGRAKDNSPFGAAAIAASAARVAAAAGKPRVGTPRPHNGTPRPGDGGGGGDDFGDAAAAEEAVRAAGAEPPAADDDADATLRTTVKALASEEAAAATHPDRPTTTPRARCPERAAHRTLSHARPRQRGAARHDCRV